MDGNHWQKGGRSLLPMGEKRQKATMVSSNIVKVFRLNACIAQAYFPTCVNAHVWHICAHGGGKGLVNIFENLHETIAKAFNYVFLLWNAPITCYVLMELSASLLVAFLTNMWKKKNQKTKNKNACQVAMSNGWMAIWTKGTHKAHCTSTWRGYGIRWYE